MNFKVITSDDEMWEKVRDYAEGCSWRAGKELAYVSRSIDDDNRN